LKVTSYAKDSEKTATWKSWMNLWVS